MKQSRMFYRFILSLLALTLLPGMALAQNSSFNADFSVALNGPAYDLNETLSLGFRTAPAASDEAGLSVSLGTDVLFEGAFAPGGLQLGITPFLNELYYRFSNESFVSPANNDDIRLRTRSDLIQVAFGRIESEDVLGLLVPLRYDGLRYSLRTANLVLDAEFGYQGLLVNSPGQNRSSDNILIAAGLDSSVTDLSLPLWDSAADAVNAAPELQVSLEGGPNALVTKIEVLSPELIGRQSPFALFEYQTLSPRGSADSINFLSGITGVTGSLSRRSFYAALASVSRVSGASVSNATGVAAAIDIRSYLDGRAAPRLGLQALVSGPGFVFPQSLSIVPDYLDFIESSVLLISADAEGLLWQSRINPRLGLGWNLRAFSAVKLFSGPGGLNDPALDSYTGYLASGFDAGLRFRPLRDLAFDLRARSIWPAQSSMEFVDAQFSIEYRY
jgi:hypothetical protein